MAPASDSMIQLPADSIGKKLRTRTGMTQAADPTTHQEIGCISGPDGDLVKVNGAGALSVQSDPLDKYKIADEDSLGATKYYGFTTEVNANTNWIILQQVVGAATTTYRYANISNNATVTGAYGLATTGPWAVRATLSYALLYTLTGV